MRSPANEIITNNKPPLFMRLNILPIAIILVIIATCTVPGCLGPGTARITSVTTDKDLYHSKEIMNITILANSQGDMSNSTIRLYGIQDRHGDFQLDQESSVNLSPGLNTLAYDHQLPSCSSYSGLSAGTYQIEVELIHNGMIVSNMTHSIQLEQ
jgi:hypothetical protein